MEEKNLKTMNQNYHLTISDKLERKIRVLCNKFYNTEWSGVLFYNYVGSFEKVIVFEAVDMMFQDIGDSTTTEFSMDDSNVAEYIANHALWDCQCGLIH